MYSITTHILSPAEARKRFEGYIDFDLEGPACEDGTLPAHAVWLPSPHLEDPAPHHVLFIAIRDVSCSDILKAATRELGHVNLISENLRDMKPFLQVGTDDWSAYVPLNLIHNILQKGDRNTIRLFSWARTGFLMCATISHNWTRELSHRVSSRGSLQIPSSERFRRRRTAGGGKSRHRILRQRRRGPSARECLGKHTGT